MVSSRGRGRRNVSTALIEWKIDLLGKRPLVLTSFAWGRLNSNESHTNYMYKNCAKEKFYPACTRPEERLSTTTFTENEMSS